MVELHRPTGRVPILHWIALDANGVTIASGPTRRAAMREARLHYVGRPAEMTAVRYVAVRQGGN